MLEKEMTIQIWTGEVYTFEIGEVLIEDEEKGYKLVDTRCTGVDWDEHIPLILWKDGTIMSPKDWQGGFRTIPEEILEYNNWIEIKTGANTVKMGKLPYLPPFSKN